MENKMSIGPISNRPTIGFYSKSPSFSAETATDNASTGPAAGADPPSTKVTLSADALALSSLNAEGITVRTVSYSPLSSGRQPPVPAGGVNGSMSKSDFEATASSFGVTTQQADQDFQAMDTNRNGAISNGEFIAAMSHTASGENPLSQSLLAMMDVNHDGKVSSNEYINLETQFVGAEKSTG
jgi:hypothetical protein